MNSYCTITIYYYYFVWCGYRATNTQDVFGYTAEYIYIPQSETTDHCVYT